MSKSKADKNKENLEMINLPFFVFDVESIGLYGELFAVAGGVYINGAARSEFRFSCPSEQALGDAEDRAWFNVIGVTHRNLSGVMDAFWGEWKKAKILYQGIIMAGECVWPVEANFLSACINQDVTARTFDAQYPLHEIASIMFSAGMDPMKHYEREESENPVHEPLANARKSARLLAEALRLLSLKSKKGTTK